MRTEIVLVRHALSVQPSENGPAEFSRPLTPEGLHQADELVDPLSALRPAAIWSSPYLRAVQTVLPTAQALGLSLRKHEDLREWEDGLAFTNDWISHYEQSWADPSMTRPGGESLEQVTARAVRVIRTLAASFPGQLVLAAGHGTLITRALYGFGAPTDWTFAQRMPLPAIYRLQFADPSAMPAITGPHL
jgi:2,3-bisphosphoglycerate-dependent phosphoglycerate mutase